MLVIDDLQWTDPSTLAALAYLRRRGAGLGVAMVTAARPTEPTCDDHLRLLAPDTVVRLEPLTVAEIREMLTPIVDQAADLSVELDGREIQPERVQSDVFSIAVPENNILDPICGEGGLPRGVYSPAADEGFYVRLDPLSPGRHTLRFSGGIPGTGQAFGAVPTFPAHETLGNPGHLALTAHAGRRSSRPS